MTPRRPAAVPVELVCAAVALLACHLAQRASHWPQSSPDLLLDIAAKRPIAGYVASLDPGFVFSSSGETYDGVYYWAMAVDPFATGTAHTLIDLAGYRYGHPLYSWLAALLSGGQAPLLPLAFWALTLASFGSAAFLVARLARRLGAAPWWGLAVAASPGLLFSATSALTEPLQVALVAAVLLVWRDRARPRPVVMTALLVATCLTKEQLVLLPAALLVDLAVRRLRGRDDMSWPEVAAVLSGPAALAAWLGYLRLVLPSEQTGYQADNIGLPFSQLERLLQLATHLRLTDEPAAQIGATAPSILVCYAVLLLAGTVCGLLRRDALGYLVSLLAVLTSCLGWRTLLYPHETLRVPAVAITFALVSLAAGTRYRG